jgi:hypothetical protein
MTRSLATKTALPLLLASAVITYPDRWRTQSAGAQTALEALAREFMPAQASLALFDAGGEFALVPTVDSRGVLTSADLVSKRQVRDRIPSWTANSPRPTMTSKDYDSFLRHLARVRPLGPLIAAGHIRMWSAGIATAVDEYEEAIVLRDIHPAADGKEQIAGATVRYLGEITAVITDKKKEVFGFCVDTAEGERATYQVPSGIYDDLVIGRRMTFRGVRLSPTSPPK